MQSHKLSELKISCVNNSFVLAKADQILSKNINISIPISLYQKIHFIFFILRSATPLRIVDKYI